MHTSLRCCALLFASVLLGGCYLFHSPEVAHDGPIAGPDAGDGPRRDAALEDVRPIHTNGCSIERCGAYPLPHRAHHIRVTKRGDCSAVPTRPSWVGGFFRLAHAPTPTSLLFEGASPSGGLCNVLVDGLSESIVMDLIIDFAVEHDYCVAVDGDSIAVTLESATRADPDDCLDGLRFYANDRVLRGGIPPPSPFLAAERADTLCAAELGGEVFSVRVGDDLTGSRRWWGAALGPDSELFYGRRSAHAWVARAHTSTTCETPGDVLAGSAALAVTIRDTPPTD